MLESLVRSYDYALILLSNHYNSAISGSVSFQDVHGIVRGAIVANYQFKIEIGLTQDAVDHLPQELAVIVIGNEYGNQRTVRQRGQRHGLQLREVYVLRRHLLDRVSRAHSQTVAAFNPAMTSSD